MLIKYSYDNVDAMIKSTNSNSELITSMVKKIKENDRQINDKMNLYANTKGVFSKDQIDLYSDYIETKNQIKILIDDYQKEVEKIGGLNRISAEICKDNSDCKTIHNVFDKINSLQIKLMEMLCGILGKANCLLSAI